MATIQQGDIITIDGSSGQVYLGAVETVDAALGSEMELLLTCPDRVRRMRVRTNADTPAQAEKALRRGAIDGRQQMTALMLGFASR